MFLRVARMMMPGRGPPAGAIEASDRGISWFKFRRQTLPPLTTACTLRRYPGSQPEALCGTSLGQKRQTFIGIITSI